MKYKTAEAQMKFLNVCSNMIIARMVSLVASMKSSLYKMRAKITKLQSEAAIQEDVIDQYETLTDNMKTVNGTKEG